MADWPSPKCTSSGFRISLNIFNSYWQNNQAIISTIGKYALVGITFLYWSNETAIWRFLNVCTSYNIWLVHLLFFECLGLCNMRGKTGKMCFFVVSFLFYRDDCLYWKQFIFCLNFFCLKFFKRRVSDNLFWKILRFNFGGGG